MKAILAAAASALALAGCAAQSPPLSVRASGTLDGCLVEVEGRRLDNDALLDFARAWPNRRAIVSMERHTPYRCVGGAIFALQRAGFRKIVMEVDGEPLTIGRPRLQPRARGLKAGAATTGALPCTEIPIVRSRPTSQSGNGGRTCWSRSSTG